MYSLYFTFLTFNNFDLFNVLLLACGLLSLHVNKWKCNWIDVFYDINCLVFYFWGCVECVLFHFLYSCLSYSWTLRCQVCVQIYSLFEFFFMIYPARLIAEPFEMLCLTSGACALSMNNLSGCCTNIWLHYIYVIINSRSLDSIVRLNILSLTSI